MMMMVMMMLRVIVIWRAGNICPQHVPQSDSAFLSTEASSLSLSIYMYDHGNGVWTFINLAMNVYIYTVRIYLDITYSVLNMFNRNKCNHVSGLEKTTNKNNTSFLNEISPFTGDSTPKWHASLYGCPFHSNLEHADRWISWTGLPWKKSKIGAKGDLHWIY